MRTNKLLFSGLISIILFLVSCSSEQTTESTAEVVVEKAKAVRIQTLSEKEIIRDVEYSANLIANEEVYLAPSTPGRIINVNAEVGDRVKKGANLIQMDPTQYNTTKIQLQSLEKDMSRLDTLLKYDGVSQQDYDQMKTQVEVTKSNLDLLATNTVIKAPFSGVITAKYFENNEIFGGAPNTQAGKAAILVIQQINPIKAIIGISEKYFPIVKEGMKINLTTDIYPDVVFSGKISLIHPTINTATKTFNAEIQIPNNDSKLRPGMYSKVNFEIAKEKAIVVPAISVLQQMGTNNRYIYLYKDGVAERVDVIVGKRFNDQIEIISDKLTIGDNLIISGHANIENGAKVKLVE